MYGRINGQFLKSPLPYNISLVSQTANNPVMLN